MDVYFGYGNRCCCIILVGRVFLVIGWCSNGLLLEWDLGFVFYIIFCVWYFK